ncbi:MAG: HAD-IIIC family phosphatase [Burkholderiales bacterium]|nr:HAD-IIIC family phosphatase [Burkholderiales bacterium]
MRVADFLFPRDLEVHPSGIEKVLVVGSCMAETFVKQFAALSPETRYDHVLFNNVGDLPADPPGPLADYAYQLVHLPYRGVFHDGFLDHARFAQQEHRLALITDAVQRLDLMLDGALDYNRRTGLLTFVSNFIVPQNHLAPSLSAHFTDLDVVHLTELMNHRIAARIAGLPNVYVLDVDAIANSLGKRYFFDDFIYFFNHGGIFFTDWHAQDNNPWWTHPAPGRIETLPPVADYYESRLDEFFEAAHRNAEALYRTARQIDQVKIVIFDLDDTLWRGQIAEHYLPGNNWPHTDGWPLGHWDAVHQLRSRGILTSICSKNDAETVEKYWDHAVRPPIIKLEHFTAPKINWRPKAENIAEILAEVGLTAKSAVFVDDNPVERAAVKEAFPEIRVIGSNPFLIKRILTWSPETQIPVLTDESARREEMVRQQIGREQERATQSRETFLNSLGSELRFIEVTDVGQAEFSRCLELLNKTNQFNTTGRRWSPAEIAEHLAAGKRMFCFSVKDRFSDYGIVGVALTGQSDIVQFVMSCRVLGMDVELAAIGALVRVMRAAQYEKGVTGQIIETDANRPCRDLFQRCGFALRETEAGLFHLGDSVEPAAAPHIAVV